MPHLIEKAFKKSCLLKPKYLFTTTGERGIFPAFLNTFQISLCLSLVETGTIPARDLGEFTYHDSDAHKRGSSVQGRRNKC